MQLAGARTAAHVAVALALAAAVLLLPEFPARAAGCAGVTAVVDFGALGGGVQEKCVADGAGQPAWNVFEEAGFPLTAVQTFPDAVCQVSGKPAGDPCYRMPPANAYWGLFWSSGSGWVYSTKGARSLTVPAGGSVGFAWQNSTAQRAPGVTAAAPRPTPTPTRAPTKKATTSPAPKTTAKPRAVATSASAAASASPRAKASARASASPTAPTPTASASVAPVATGSASPSDGPSSASAAGPLQARDTAQQSSGSLPWWGPVIVVLALLGAAGGVWWRRRASG